MAFTSTFLYSVVYNQSESTNKIIKWEFLAYVIIPGTIIIYILGWGRGSGGGSFYFGLLLSSSRMNKLSAYAFIKCTVIQGNIYDLIMIKKGSIMCMYKYGKIQCRGIWSLARNPSSYKRNKIGLVIILLGVKNDIRHSMARMNQYHNYHNLQMKETLIAITWPLMETFTFS